MKVVSAVIPYMFGERSGIYVGVLNPDLVVYPGTAYSQYFHHLQGKKQYELTNHLGNVLNTINDRKIGVDTATTDGHYDYSQDNDGNQIIMSPDAWHKQYENQSTISGQN